MKFTEMPYERADIEKIKSEFAGIVSQFENAASGEEQFEAHKKYYALVNHASSMMTLAHIRHDIDVTDKFYAAEQDYYDEVTPVFENLIVSYQRKFYNSKFRPFLEEKVGGVAFTNIELAMKSVDEKLIPLMQEENALTTKYDKLLANAVIHYNGEDLNLSLMTPYLKSGDRNVRKDAWEKFTGFFVENREELDDIYDKLVKNRTEQAKMMGYPDYTGLGYCRMNRNSYDRNAVASFRESVKKYIVPLAEKIHAKRAGRIGVDKLRYYDEGVYFEYGNPKPVLGPDGILDAGRKMYGELSPETGEFMNFMCDNMLFDVLGRKTKKTGGYMTYIPDYKSPFIFANFNGTSGDVDVITHECGHAFQGYLSGFDPILEHSDITMETAETHSMSMEFFTEKWADLFFGERGDDYREMHIEDTVAFIPYGTMVDEFQDIIYSEPSLTPAERKSVWRDLEKQYKPHLDYEGNEYYESGGFWQKQAHIYDVPFYYIDYCIAAANALQYKVKMDEDFGSAWDSYLSLCRLSASDYFDGLCRKAGLSSPLEESCLRDICGKLESRF